MLSEKEILGQWKKELILGSGGFGVVTQWINIESKETLAIKQCRLLVESALKPKLCRRWEVEVDIMKKLKHPNVVAPREVPEELQVGKDDMPLMAMEYCSKGDLRKVLTRPENSCGLLEAEVLTMTKHIASAVEYLHSMRIIHRDLKPENVVLQEADNKITYKLIDLGYAKELDQNSLCTSFVGTLHYLAPELFAGKKYTCTVDYWSFGFIVFECITGMRPFLANESPYQWQMEVKKKGPDDICAFYDSEGQIIFSNKLFKPNHINPIYQDHFENWLQLMLRWDPQQRGGGLLPNEKRPKCFKILDDIHKLLIVKVYCIITSETLFFEVTENTSMIELKEKIAQKIAIPVEEQELLLPRGDPPDMTKPASQCCCLLDSVENDWMVFVYQKNKIPSFEINTLPLPENVQTMLQDPKDLVDFNQKKKMSSHAVYYCQALLDDYKNLNFSQKVILANLMVHNSELMGKKTVLKDELCQLIAETNFFTKSIQTNIDFYQKQVTNGFSSEKMLNQWKSRLMNLKKSTDEQKQIVADLKKLVNSIEIKTGELQKSPFTYSKQNSSLEKQQKDILREYEQLCRSSKESRVSSTNEVMVTFLARSIIERKKLSLVLITHLERLLQCKTEITVLIPKFNKALSDIREIRNKLLIEHKDTQADIWNLILILQNQLNTSPHPSSLVSTGYVTASHLPSDINQTPFSLENIHLSEGLNMSLSQIVDKSAQETSLLISNNEETRFKLNNTFMNFAATHKQSLDQINSLDFSFLNN